MSVSDIITDLNIRGDTQATNFKNIKDALETLESDFGNVVSVLTLGAVGDGSTDDTTAITNAFTQAIAGNFAIYFPAGRYKLTSALTISLLSGTNHLTIYGDGPDSSILYWSEVSSGLGIVYNSFYDTITIRDLSFTTGQVGTQSNPALTLFMNVSGGPVVAPLNVIDNVSFRGDDGYGQNDYWSNAITINQVSNINFNNSVIVGPSGGGGSGIIWEGAIANFSIVLNIIGSYFSKLNFGLFISGYCQGLSVTATNFLENLYGIYAPNTAASLAEVAIANSLVDASVCGIAIFGGGYGITICNNFFELTATDARAIDIEGTASLAPFFTISGNHFEAPIITTNIGIYTAGMDSAFPTGAGTIIANEFVNLNQAIDIASGSKDITIIGNTFASTVVTSLTDSGSGTTALNNGSNVNKISTTLDLAASTTAAPSLNIPTGTAPTSPSNGDFWFDGTNVKIRVGASTKTFTLT